LNNIRKHLLRHEKCINDNDKIFSLEEIEIMLLEIWRKKTCVLPVLWEKIYMKIKRSMV
jgi:hypothetical protein